MKWLMSGLAALALGLAVAPVAAADANDDAFIEATDRVIMMSSGDNPEWHWVGYPGVPAQLRIDTAKTACSMMDTGVGGQAINDFIVAALDDRREHAGYYAAWFGQSAITHYCPQHSDRIGII